MKPVNSRIDGMNGTASDSIHQGRTKRSSRLADMMMAEWRTASSSACAGDKREVSQFNRDYRPCLVYRQVGKNT